MAAAIGIDHRHALGDVLGVIADAFDDGGDLERRHHLAQIDRHRRTQRDDADREPLHLRLDRIDRLVVGAHARGEFGIGAGERLHGECDGILGKPAHLRDHAAQLADIGVECLDRVIHH